MKAIIKKSSIIILICSGILLMNSEVRAQTKEKQNSPKMENTEAKTEILQLTIEGMSCQAGCANGIDNLLMQQDGIIKSRTFFDSSSSEIYNDEKKISKNQIIDLIEKRDFKPTIRERKNKSN